MFGWAEKIGSDLSARARGTELSCSTLEEGIGKKARIASPGKESFALFCIAEETYRKARRGGVCVQGKRSPREILFVFTSSCRYDLIDV